MEQRFYDEYARIETTHWWFLGRHAILRAMLPTLVSSHPDTRILDVGCGTGHMLRFLQPYAGRVIGLDLAAEAIAYARGRTDAPLVQAAGQAIPFRDESVDVISMLDIIEHVGDDAGILAEGARCLRANGLLLAAVPAFQALWGSHDELNHHRRRYRLGELRSLVEGAGLIVERATYFNTLLFPPIATVRLIRRLLPTANGAPLRSDFELTRPGRVNDFLARLFALEAVPLRTGRLPFGATAFIAARKPA